MGALAAGNDWPGRELSINGFSRAVPWLLEGERLVQSCSGGIRVSTERCKLQLLGIVRCSMSGAQCVSLTTPRCQFSTFDQKTPLNPMA